MPLLVGFLGYVDRRLNPQHGDALFHEILQQVAVVAGQFHHQAVVVEREALDHQVGVGLQCASQLSEKEEK